MKKIKRSRNYVITAELRNDAFIRAPREAQRQWLVQRAVDELAWNFESLDRIARTLVRGGDQHPLEGSLSSGDAEYQNGQLKIHGQAVMEDWQHDLMRRLAEIAASNGGHVLEVGFGLGFAASVIQERRVKSHTVVECNPSVAERFQQWRRAYPDRDIRLVLGRWQDLLDRLEIYDGILFDTYPLTHQEFVKTVLLDVTFAEHFFDTAADHLVSGGVFAYFTGELDSLSRTHQRLLLNRFSEISISLMRGLLPQPDSQMWWAPTMAIVKAIK